MKAPPLVLLQFMTAQRKSFLFSPTPYYVYLPWSLADKHTAGVHKRFDRILYPVVGTGKTSQIVMDTNQWRKHIK